MKLHFILYYWCENYAKLFVLFLYCGSRDKYIMMISTASDMKNLDIICLKYFFWKETRNVYLDYNGNIWTFSEKHISELCYTDHRSFYKWICYDMIILFKSIWVEKCFTKELKDQGTFRIFFYYICNETKRKNLEWFK